MEEKLYVPSTLLQLILESSATFSHPTSGECLLSTGPTSEASKEKQEKETHTASLAVRLQWGCLALRDI